MTLHRFMSKREYDALMTGEVLRNETDHGAMGKKTDSVGFCFFPEPPDEEIHWLSFIVTTKDRISLVSTKFIANEYSGGGQLSSIEQPNPAVLTTPKQKIVSAQYLMNPQYQSAGGSIDNPCFTLIARMDKMPPYLITTKEGAVGIAIYESDSPWMRRVKEFMAAYGIVDICMRMLNIGELKRIMGFPTDYVLIGTQAEQKKYIGNAVEVNMSRVLCEALCRKIKSMNQ